MKKVTSFFIFFVFLLGIVGNISTKATYNDIDSHLKDFVEFNQVHHDNIDNEPHTHKHKHSDDGEEHEHNHQHTKVTQSEIKLLNCTVNILGGSVVIESKNGFTEKNLISNPHPSRIYRPPILV